MSEIEASIIQELLVGLVEHDKATFSNLFVAIP